MQSRNFEFLRTKCPDLAALGGFAECYVHIDPASALVKLRTFIESMVQGIYRESGLPLPVAQNLNDLLRTSKFSDAVPKSVRLKMNAVRDHGNKAAHGEDVSQANALWLLKECAYLAQWFYMSHLGGKATDCPAYEEPPVGGIGAETKGRLKEEKRAALEKLAVQEDQLQTLMVELDTMRAQATTIVPERDISVLAQIGQAAADELQFSEEETRKWLIDSQLVAAGWDVGHNGAATDEVTQEEEVLHQPTDTGLGYIDYVLWDDNGKPLAVVEAKKTAEDAGKGQTQARLYADGLEKMHDRRPVIFYTNGFDIWIWDDAQNYPPRQLFGFYSKDSLQYLIYQRESKQALENFSAKTEIIDRLYQYEAVKRVCERFTNKRRKALVVQATGTGKTRVAIALTELLIRASWVKRVLFLCDRRELRKQAKNFFNDYLSKEPLVVVGAKTAKDRNQRIYLATYPAMTKIFQSFDPGFFSLIIADESHRSIYNIYGDLFRYFDSLQVGLTATPVEFVTRNTFQLFEHDNQNPAYNYSYAEAVEQGYLVPFEVFAYQTHFLKRGIKFEELTDEQREELTDQGEDPQLFDYEPADMDKNIFNKDTARHILCNLMENGIKDGTGQTLGKSIIFARNHEHAVLLRKLFDELYPQYGGKFCQVIDNYDPRAEQLIDDFKTLANELTIAISVDMLDTGIDVPEVVNLVFAKPVFSKVKFWQMIGRGTRLCHGLFGEGKDKKAFAIFDHWANFDYFDFHYKHVEPIVSKPLMQNVFEAHIDLADAALPAESQVFQLAIGLILADLNSLPEDSISVRGKWREKRAVAKTEVLDQFDPTIVAVLRTEMAPLMQWVNIRGYTEAYELDLLIARMQIDLLRKSGRFDDYKITLMDRVNSLQMHLNPVREKADTIKQIRASSFWATVTPQQLEDVRKELRYIIHHVAASGGGMQKAKVVDVTDTLALAEKRPSSIPAVDMQVYRQEVEKVLSEHFDKEPVLQKIRLAKPVTDVELEQLVSLVLTQHPDVNLNVLTEFYDTALPLDFVLRSVVGLDTEVVKERFTSFVQKHPHLNAKQTRFLSLLQNHIARYGSIEVERLYEDPFTLVDANGLDGVFQNGDAEDIVHVISTFAPTNEQELPKQ